MKRGGKGSCFNQDFFWDETEERNTTRKTIQPEDDIYFQSDSDSDDGIYSGSSHSPYEVVNLRLRIPVGMDEMYEMDQMYQKFYTRLAKEFIVFFFLC